MYMRQIAYINFIIRNENKSQGLSEGKNVKRVRLIQQPYILGPTEFAYTEQMHRSLLPQK